MAKKTTKKDTKTASKAKTSAKSTKSKTSAKTTSTASTKAASTKKQSTSKPTDKKNVSQEKTTTQKPNYKIIGLIAVVGLIVAAFFMLRNQIIVATVNGKPVTRWQLVRELEKQGGQQVLEGIVIQTIIDQEANKKGLTVTDQDLDSEIDKLRTQIPQGMTLEQMLQLQGMDIEGLKQQLKIQIKLRKILEDQITVSDEEVNKTYEDQKEQYAQVSEEEAKLQVKEALIQQKLSFQINTWIEQKKNEADVKYYLFKVEQPEQTQPQVEQQIQEVPQEQPTELPQEE